MKIAFNPSTVAALITPPNNKDITFDLRGRNIFARGVKFCGTDTWRDIKINNVSIGSNILDLRDGDNTTLTNINGVVTINSTWRPVVDNLTSDSTTSSLSANLGRVLKSLIDGKSDSDHNHDDRYLRLTGGLMLGDITFGGDNKIIWGRNTDSASISFKNDGDGDADSYMSFVTSDNGNEYFRWSHSSGSTNTEWMALRSDGLRVGGTKVSLEGHSHDDRYVKRSGDTMLGALNFANGTWNLVGDDSYMGDCNISGHFGIKAANTTYPGIAFFNNANDHLGNLTAYNGNIKYGAYSLQFLDNGNTSVSASTWTNPFSGYNSNAVADGQAICVWGLSSYLGNLANDSGDMSLWLKRVNANVATLNMVLDGEYYANGSLRLAHVSEIPNSLKNPYALTISLNGTSQGPYDGSAAKNINITPSSIGAATSDHNHINYLSANGNISGNIDDIWTHGTYGFVNRSNYTGTLPGNSSYGGFLVLNPLATTTRTYYTTQIALLPGYFGYRIYDDGKWYNWKEVSMVGHNHDSRYVRYYTVTTLDCNNLAVGLTAAGVSATNAAHTNHSAFLYISDVGTPFLLQIPDSSVPYIYKRYYSSGTWSGWFKLNAGYADSAGSATQLQTPRSIWGQSFDGTGNVDGTLRIRNTTSNYCEGIRIQNGDNTWATIILGATSDYGTNTNAWSIHRKDDNNFAISRNSSDGTNGLVMTSVGMGLGTTAPTQRLDVAGNIRTTGDIYISHNTNDDMSYNTSNPRIVFSENGSLAVGLVYTDYDSYRHSKGLKVMDINNDDAGNVWFEVQGYNYSSGYVKNGSSDSYVLLGGGGHKLESALNVAYSKYLTGITLTGGNGNNEGYRLIFERTMGGWTINYGVWAIALRHSGRGTLNIGFDTTNSDGSTYTYNIRFLGSTASRESTPFRAFYNTSTKVFRIYWHYYDYTSGEIAVLRGNMEPYNGTWMTSLPNDVGTELAITCNMADLATNADTVDGYHASSLWRSDGATWNPSANISLTASGDNQEWSFDIRRNGHTGCFWQVWDSALSTLLKVNADNGKVYAPYNFVGNLEGNASTATALATNAGNSINPVYFSGGKPIACTMSTGRGDGILRSFGRGAYKSANQYFGNGTIVTIDPKGTGCISANDTILSLGDTSVRNTQLLVAWDRDGVYYRRITDNLDYGNWNRLAFTTDNVASATKLQTPRTLWYRNTFDGTNDVNGVLCINNSNASGNFDEGIRILNKKNGWVSITMCGTDAGDNLNGTSYNTWAICNEDGKFYITKRGSSSGLMLLGMTSNKFRIAIEDSLNGGIASSLVNYSNNSPYGLLTRIYNTGVVSLQSLRESNNEELFGLSLQPLGGNVGIGTVNPPYKLTIEGVGGNCVPIQLVNASRDGDWVCNAAFFAPNLTNNHNNVITIGKSYGARNAFGLTHMHIKDGSASNYAALEVWGVGNVLRWYYDRHSAFLHRADFSSLGSDASYMNSALLIREHGYNGTQADTWANAPRMSWHWSGRVQTQIGLGSNNELYLSKNNFGNAYRLMYETGTWGINISGNAASATNADTALYLRSLGNLNCQTGRTLNYGDVYSYNIYNGNTNSPTTYSSVIGFGRGTAGTVEIAGGWCNTHLYWRSLRDCCENWYSWRTVLDSSNYTEFIKYYGGDNSHPIFLGYLNLDHGNDGTISSSFYCLGYSVPFTYTRGGNYCRINIPDTTHQVFYIRAAIASVNYSGGGMDTWVGEHRGDGAWWLHCYASSTNEVRVKGFHLRNSNNDSWWGGNPLWSDGGGANRITVCIFGYVTFR